jgi:hypothetical protein
VPRVQQEIQAAKETKDPLDSLEHREHKDHRDLRAQLDQEEQLDPQEIRARSDHRVIKAHLVHLGLQATKVTVEPLVPQVQLVQQVHRATKDHQDLLVHQGKSESLELLALREIKELRARMVRVGALELQGLQVRMVSKDSPVLQDHPVIQDHQGLLDSEVHQDLQVTSVYPDQTEIRDCQAIRDIPVRSVRLD